ncbi:hypothetical protein ACOMHN_020838 [Nucella lapillus]
MNSMDLSSVGLTNFSSQSDIFSISTTTPSLSHAKLTVASSIGGKTEHGCLVVEQKFNPMDNPENIVSKQTHFWISTIIYAIIIPLLFLVGVPGNILSAAVFYRQGLRERINLCVFCLALMDLVVICVIFGLGVEKAYRSLVGPFNFFITYFVGLTGFTWVSMFLSAVIAAERCFCVVSPLRAQRMLSTRTLAVVITSISLLLLTGMLVIAGPKHTEVCVFDPQTNTTSLIVYVTDYYLQNKNILDIFDIFVYALTLPSVFLAIVIVTTIITTAKLRSVLRWRQQSSSASGVQTSSTSETQMVALTWTLVATSVLFVLCTSPVLFVQMSIFFVKELKAGGRFHNLRTLSWGFIDLFRCINCSLNFFIYYRMGSRFRQTLKGLLGSKGTDVGLSHSDRVGSRSNSEVGKQRVSTSTLSENKNFA